MSVGGSVVVVMVGMIVVVVMVSVFGVRMFVGVLVMVGVFVMMVVVLVGVVHLLMRSKDVDVRIGYKRHTIASVYFQQDTGATRLVGRELKTIDTWLLRGFERVGLLVVTHREM